MKNLFKRFRWRDIWTILSLFLILLAVLACGIILAKFFNVAFSDWLTPAESPVLIPN